MTPTPKETAMNDQTTPANLTRKEAQAVREWAERAWSTKVQDAVVAHAARVLLAVLPPRPTLADMTEEERAACQWMQADIIGGDEPLVITHIERSDGTAVILDRNGRYDEVPAGAVTPRPDLPRMEWPGDKKADDVPPVKVGDVIESADDPRLDALPVGSVLTDRDGKRYTVTKNYDGTWGGTGYAPIPSQGDEFGPWTVLHIPKEDDQ